MLIHATALVFSLLSSPAHAANFPHQGDNAALPSVATISSGAIWQQPASHSHVDLAQNGNNSSGNQAEPGSGNGEQQRGSDKPPRPSNCDPRLDPKCDR
jgi:hypothetical protein